MNDKYLDLTSEPTSEPSPAARQGDRGRFIGVRFECCGVYSRVYPNAQCDAYEGRCPRCLKPIRFEIGPGGTSTRFFTVS